MEIESIIEHSFKDYHVKGFDYICLKRSPEHTIKYYFFDGYIEKLPEVVSPHDHRYCFLTKVLAGSTSNSVYYPHEAGEIFNMFEYRTKLNGGNGFSFIKEMKLLLTSKCEYEKNTHYWMDYNEIHTINITGSQTVLRLDQFEDRLMIDSPTVTFMKDKTAPSLDGLYSKFTADEVLKRLNIIERLEKNINMMYEI